MSDLQNASGRSSSATARVGRGGRRSKGPKRPAAPQEWEWEKLVADDKQTLDTAWCMLLDTPGLAEDVPVESRTPVLDCGFTCWNSSLTLTTTRCAVLFRRLLGVPMVSSEFVTYRDAFLFALSVHWDVDVAKYDLTPEQSQAAFAFVDLLAADLTYGRAGLTSGEEATAGRASAPAPGNPADAGDPSEGERPGHADGELEEPDKYAMTKQNIRAVRKQAGASRWAIRLGRLLENIIMDTDDRESNGAGMDVDGWRSQAATEPANGGGKLEVAMEVWSVLLRTEEGAQKLLKDKHREAKARRKRKAKRAEKRERKAKDKGRGGAKGKRSYSSSESSSASSDFSDSSSDDGGRAARKSSSSSTSPDYQKVFESTQHAPGAPAFVWIKGEPHFRSRNSGDLVNCARQPKTPCRICGHCHWYWQGGAYSCRGQYAKKH